MRTRDNIRHCIATLPLQIGECALQFSCNDARNTVITYRVAGTGLQQAALARVNRPAAERRDFFLYVDEFQNFTVASFESILAESASTSADRSATQKQVQSKLVNSHLWGLNA